jgi:hypothetical protein
LNSVPIPTSTVNGPVKATLPAATQPSIVPISPIANAPTAIPVNLFKFRSKSD